MIDRKLLHDHRSGHADAEDGVILTMIFEGAGTVESDRFRSADGHIARIPQSVISRRRMRFIIDIMPGYCRAFGNGDRLGHEFHITHCDSIDRNAARTFGR